jgi:hypothetical protein
MRKGSRREHNIAAQHDVEAVGHLAPCGRSVGRSLTSGRWADWMDTRYWSVDALERRSRVLALLAAIVGSGWAVFLLIQVLVAVGAGFGGLIAYAILFGPGWLVYIGLLRRGLGITSWKDPTSLWWACIGINSLWLVIFLLSSIDSLSLRSVAGLASAAASISLSAAGLGVERRLSNREDRLQVSGDIVNTSPSGRTPR